MTQSDSSDEIDGLTTLMMSAEGIKTTTDPFAAFTGRDVKVGIIDSGVNPAHPHVGGVAGGARISSGEANPSNDYLDYIGHGTAVAGAIREKAADAQLYAVKVFDRALTTNIDAIVKAIEWCIENDISVINLSLGTVNPEHRAILERVVACAAEKGTVLVAAREMSNKPSLPGCLQSVIGVVVDWKCARDRYTVSGSDGDPVFIASAYPREIPGVPRERNMNGISFAVANMTGFVARAREFVPDISVDQLKRLLVEESTRNEEAPTISK